MSLPQKLLEYRQAQKLSQEDLAHQLGVSRQSVSKWEQGLSFPETEKLIELSYMMGVTIDSLLKDDPTPTPPETTPEEAPAESPAEPPAAPSQTPTWLKVLAILLVGLVSVTALITLHRNSVEPTPSETEPEQSETTAPSEVESLPTATIPVPEETEPPFQNKDLEELQTWFFDFARTYRLDYMPTFTAEEGAPTDSGEYLYWAFAINLDSWGEDKGKMTRDYVEETVLMYFAVIPGQHRSHLKSWNYDPDTEIYTAYPESLKQLDYYLLTSIEISEGLYTVHATRYRSESYGFSEEEVNQLKTALFEGVNTELTPISELTVTFRLDHVFHQPVFHSYSEEFLP